MRLIKVKPNYSVGLHNLACALLTRPNYSGICCALVRSSHTKSSKIWIEGFVKESFTWRRLFFVSPAAMNSLNRRWFETNYIAAGRGHSREINGKARL